MRMGMVIGDVVEVEKFGFISWFMMYLTFW